MKQAFYLITIFMLTGCLSNETYNKIPCDHDFTTIHDSLKKFGLRTHGESPDGFKWKEAYDSTLVDCSKWTILIGIDSCNPIFYDEKYVVNLAALIFNEPKNKAIENIKFELSQCVFSQDGQRKFYYEISRKNLENGSFKPLPESKNAVIIKKISKGYSNTPNNKIVSLLLDSLPSNPYSIAHEYAIKNKEFKQINLIIENVDSRICKRVEYLYGFE